MKKIRVHNPDQLEAEVLMDNVGNGFMAIKFREGDRHDVFILEKSDAIGVIRTLIKEAKNSGWELSDE